MLQPAASERPVITNTACTPPSGVPSRLRTKRASRTGPLAVTNDGTTFLAPCAVATATWGLVAGLEPPTAGCEWQPVHPSRLNRGPKPSATPSTSWNTSLAASKKARSTSLRPASASPAPASPPRTPGSTGPRELPDVLPVVVVEFVTAAFCANAASCSDTDASITVARLASEHACTNTNFG